MSINISHLLTLEQRRHATVLAKLSTPEITLMYILRVLPDHQYIDPDTKSIIYVCEGKPVWSDPDLRVKHGHILHHQLYVANFIRGVYDE